MDLSGRSAQALSHVFTPPRKVISTTSAWSVALLALFGLSFASSVQNGYARIWKPSAGPWHRLYRQLVWLVVLMVYVYTQVQTRNVLAGTPRVPLSLAVGLLFFWWSAHFLLAGEVRWRHLLPGAVATMAGLVGLRWFSYLVFTPLLITNAVSYGPMGTIVVVESWLVGVGFVVFGGALVGRLLCERFGYTEEPPEDESGTGQGPSTVPSSRGTV